MLELIRNITLLIGITALTAAVILYLRTHADYRNGLIHKAGNLLLYGYLKLYITISQLKTTFHTYMKAHFSRYPFETGRSADLHQKEQHLLRLKNQLNHHTPKYNLKILK